MAEYTIKKINNIAKEGLKLFGSNFEVSAEATDPHGILVRSSTVNVEDYPSLIGVARAGAGTNNINVARATELGICVLNTQGANANAVVDLVFPMIGVWRSNILKGIEFCRSLSHLPADHVSAEVEKKK